MDVKRCLLSSVEEVLDKMAFMFFDEVPDEPPQAEDFSFVTQVRFAGVIAGTLNLFVNATGAEQIARNLIGIRAEDELYPDTLRDALREFTNLVMGRTMTILDPDGPFEMEVPQLVEQPEAPDGDHTQLIVDGALDDEPFRILLRYRESAAA